MNHTKRIPRGRKTPQCGASELEGYIELGMKREAINAARKIFLRRRISSDEFFEAIRAIGVFSDFAEWKAKIESAYERQSRRFQQQCRSAMLSLYFSLGDAEKAAQYISTGRTPSPADAFFSMNILLELGRLKDAEALAKKIGRLLNRAQESPAKAFLIESLARYFARLGKWDTAAEVWSWAPLNQVFRSDALIGEVHLHLARALDQTYHALEILSKIRQNHEPDCEITIPGNEEGLTRDLEKELGELKRQLEKILSENRRIQLGLVTTTTADHR